MKKLKFIPVFIIILSYSVRSQDLSLVANSIRLEYHIPEIAYAVVSTDSIYEMNCLGYKRADSNVAAEITDRFHLGSNTKAITGLIAALLVKENKINWDTKFFDLCPEMQQGSNSAYINMTLLDLMEHRAKIQAFTDGEKFPNPQVCRFKGDISSQRYQFVKWVLSLAPVHTDEPVSYSNAGYSMAAVMLEKVSGKSWEELVLDLGRKTGLDFGFSWPGVCDDIQPWGHWLVDGQLIVSPPNDSYRISWVEPAGDINMNLPDYAKFIQMQLEGLHGKSSLLCQKEFEYMHYSVPEYEHYSIGWTWAINKNNHRISAFNGSAETFIAWVYIVNEIDKGYIIMVNCGSELADQGVRKMLRAIIDKYGS